MLPPPPSTPCPIPAHICLAFPREYLSGSEAYFCISQSVLNEDLYLTEQRPQVLYIMADLKVQLHKQRNRYFSHSFTISFSLSTRLWLIEEGSTGQPELQPRALGALN